MTATGFVLLDKPVGPTSHDVVDTVRGALRTKRVGHAGTLDPLASGLLVVAAGPATRFLRYVQGLPKTYAATGVLGVRTTTLDAAGEVVERREVRVSAEEVRAAAAAFVGEIEQVPPAHSAVKVGGERAYRLARKGEEVTVAPRRVTVHELEVTLGAASPAPDSAGASSGEAAPTDAESSEERFELHVRCSAGTYVRSLIADIGERLGCGAYVERLRRTAIGHLEVTDAVPPDGVGPDTVRTIERILVHLRRVDVGAETSTRARHGRPVPSDVPSGLVLLCGPDGAVGVFEAGEGMLRPVTVLGS